MVSAAFRYSNAPVRPEEISLVYQPVRDLHNGGCIGAEVLGRIKSHNGDNACPPRLQQAFQMQPELTLHMLSHACDSWKDLRQSISASETGRHHFIGINIPPRILAIRGLEQDIGRILDSKGIDPHEMKIEILETRFTPNDDEKKILAENLIALRKRKHPIAIDDYGTAGSNMSRVKDLLDLDALTDIKIDRSILLFLSTPAAKLYNPHEHRGLTQEEFIDRVHQQLERQLANIHNMLRSGLQITAEGPENKADVHIIKAYAHLAQGFHYSIPLPEEEFRQYFTDNCRSHGDDLSDTLEQAPYDIKDIKKEYLSPPSRPALLHPECHPSL